MDLISIIFQITLAIGIFNVWFIRSSKATSYRGKNAGSLKEEFAAYGLSESVFYLVGVLKISAAVALILGLWIPSLVMPGAALMSLLMLGAFVMHIKVNDPAIRSLPALLMLFMSLFLLF